MWFKQVANNSLSYLNAQIEPLRHRQKYGKTSEEISMEIKNELQTTISREKDVKRKIREQETKRKKIRSKHQELNFRVQNLDENRQFLFKQTTEYEQKLTNHAQKQRNLLMAMDKLKTQRNEIENIKLRSISLNLKGANEISMKAMDQASKLKENRRKLDIVAMEHTQKHTLLSDVIEELSQKRDLIGKNLRNTQTEHGVLVKINENNQNTASSSDAIEIDDNNDIINEDATRTEMEYDHEMTTIFDNTNLQSAYDKCQSELEAVHVAMGRVVLEKLNTEKELLRINDMLQLQHETLESMEHSRIQYSMQQQRYLKLTANISAKVSVLQNKLNRVKDEMKRVRDDIQAIKEASASLSQKKFDLANKLKQTIDNECAMSDSLKILHRNRMSLRSRKSQLLKQHISLYEECDKSMMRYYTQTVQIIRTDCNVKSNGVDGVLTLSKQFMTFIVNPTGNRNRNRNKTKNKNHDLKYNIKHEFIDISHSNLINYSSPTQLPQLLLYLEGDIPYQQSTDNCYKFKLQQSGDKNALLMMHNFIETKRDLLYKLQKNITKQKQKQKQKRLQQQQQIQMQMQEQHTSDSPIWDIEIEDEFYCDCTSGYELRQIISSCPLRMRHIFKWKLFYSTAIHGISMQTLYGNCESMDESILIIKDSTNCIFGAFIDVPWIVSAEYRGSIDCFVFQFVAKQRNDKEEQKREDESDSHSKHKFIVYKASGHTPYIMRNDMESITIGAGECPALYFDQDLNFGRSTKCTTFRSEQLSKDTQFQITTLEIWGAINII